jgi:cyclic-di-AMP phosphodiesterase PgpH
MFGSFDRKRLIKKGFACQKQRRKPIERDWIRKLDSNPWVRACILGTFVLVLALLILSGLNQEPAKYFLIGLLVFLTAVAQLWINYPETFRKNSRVGLVFGTMLFHLCAAKLVMVFCSDPRGGLAPEFGVLLIPYALAPLVLSVLLGKNYGVYAAVFVSLWSSILFRGVDAFLLVMSLISGFIAVFDESASAPGRKDGGEGPTPAVRPVGGA